MARFDGTILALDLATTFGWCEGATDRQPFYGSERFAPAGADSNAIFGGAVRWLGARLVAFKPRRIVYEAPLAPSLMRGRTNMRTARILLGLPAIIEGVAYTFGVYDVREARVADVRNHFIGSNPRGPEGKRATVARCRQLGFSPTDDNAADAIALWHYAAAHADAAASLRQTPMFEGAAK